MSAIREQINEQLDLLPEAVQRQVLNFTTFLLRQHKLEVEGEFTPKCPFCSQELIEKRTTYIADMDTCIVIVRDVPSFVCERCGEPYYTPHVADRLKEIVDAAKAAVIELAVVRYSEKST